MTQEDMSAEQMAKAPPYAVYVWPHPTVNDAGRLALSVGRSDLTVVSIDFDPFKLGGRRVIPEVIMDHDCFNLCTGAQLLKWSSALNQLGWTK